MPRRSALPSLLFVIAATCLPLCGCQTSQVSPYVKDGRRYGVTRGTFNARWWNYYERGLSFADGEFWKEAERDLLSALAQNDGEERRAQTYGMHFIEYFPHRELGVVYYRQNRLDEAERELLRSLEDEDTAKAHYFLAQVRGQALRRGGRDARPPTVTLPGGDTWYSSSTHFMLRGIMQDDHAVAAYAVNDTSYYVREPRKAVPLEVRMALAAAQTPLTITAVDLVGNTTIHHATILLDQTGPFLVVEKKTRLVEGWEISGRATDNLGAVELTLDDRRVALQEGRFTAVARGADRAVLRARDRAGNAT
ncbi:hypothetical protein HS125_08700 [bacterium]|nr:hypothetical protein [bacterium]